MQRGVAVAAVRRIGLFGGTFDPIHYAHLLLAERAFETMELEQVCFIPAGAPPHKIGSYISPAAMRVAMVQLATQDNPHFTLSTMEIDRPGPSYTYQTVAAFADRYPTTELYLILGGDMLLDFPHWQGAELILRQAYLVAAKRPGYFAEEALDRFGPLQALARRRLRWVEMPMHDISSTNIRHRVQELRSIRYLLPDVVIDYIYRNELYREG